jgi:guanylate cyclase activator 1
MMDIEQMVAELFDVFDENKDGVISRREFVALVESLLHRKEIGFSSNIFKKFDTNHDNVISKEELIDMIVELAL